MGGTESFGFRALICYLLTAILMFFYIYVLLQSKNYSVSDEYRMFYIDGELKHYLPDDGLKQYTVDNEYLYTNVEGSQYYNRGQGWSNAVYESGTWAIGNCSEMYFYFSDITSMRFYIKYNQSEAGDNCLYVNDKEVGVLSINPVVEETAVCEINIDSAFFKEGINKIGISPVKKVDDEANNLLVYSIGFDSN